MNPTELDLLVIAAHPDDAELSVGGTILMARQKGLRVGILDLTDGEPTPHGSLEIRAVETLRATEILGVEWRHQLGLPNRKVEATLEAREKLAGVLRLTRPKIILSHYWEDVHPDHVAASRLVDDARFWAKLSKTEMPGLPYWPPQIFYYHSIHLRIHPQPSFVVDISTAMEQKIKAVECYESQLITGRAQTHPTVIDDVRDRARYWGWSIHAAYGEPLISREEIRVPGLHAFL
jgi:bacillithiol biosynthesis deacetylase BshB1